MKTDATNVPDYLEALPAARRAAVTVACERLQRASDVEETFQHGMPFYTLGGESFIAVASQKRYLSLYVAGMDETLPEQPALSDAVDGINRGKSCLRFRDTQLDRLTPELVDSLIEVTRDWRISRG